MTDAAEFPHEIGEQHSTEFMYRPQVRASRRAFVFGGVLIDSTWQGVPTGRGAQGVRSLPDRTGHGLVSYEAAEALSWWLLAELALEYRNHEVDTRIVRVKIESWWKLTEVGLGEASAAYGEGA
jgi:hypothetical protein